MEASGATFTNSDKFEKNDTWVQIWERIVKLDGKLYNVPGGSVCRKIVFLFAKEVASFGNGTKKSEQFICFLPLMLQRDKNI